MKLLILESTCDETAAAIVSTDFEVLGAVVASQVGLHKEYNGVVPELAARAHVERILPVIDQTLKRASTGLHEIEAIAVATTPGLAGSLLIGLVAAKALAVALNKPLISINHLHAHIYACQLASKTKVFPCVGFIVSGGHSNLYRCETPFSFQYLGGTIDDAAGEAFDKVATMLNLSYPGGPNLSKLAESGNPRAFRFPRPFLNEPDKLQLSFSGLKTAVRYAICPPERGDFDNSRLTDSMRADLAASFEAAIVDSLVGKAMHSLAKCQLKRLCVGGGVAANRVFRKQLTDACEAGGIELHIAPPELCTDNAVMGAIAVERFQAGLFESINLDITAGLERS